MLRSYLRPLKLYVWFPCYAGNGGYASLAAEVCRWWSVTRPIIAADPRIGEIVERYVGDTPITMTRNAAVKEAKKLGCDLVLMIDSDMHPDLYVGLTPDAKPFWQTAFDFVYARMERKLPTVAFAPYCGPPPHENVYVFHIDEMNGDTYGAPSQVDVPNGLHPEAYSRAHAAMMSGIVPAYAGPTGAILFTLDALACRQDSDAGKPWFYYEWKNDVEQAEKASTEDVTFTRDISIGAYVRGLGPVVFCLWDCWWGHLKNKIVGKPFPVHPEIAALKLANMGRLDLDKRNAAQKESIEEDYPDAFGDGSDDVPAPTPDPPTPVSDPDAETRVYLGVPYSDERLDSQSLEAVSELFEALALTRKDHGYVMVWGDRDLALTRMAAENAVLNNRTSADFGVAYQSSDEAPPSVAWMDNAMELGSLRRMYEIVAPLRPDVSPERMDFDGQKIHAIVDLRPRVANPIAPLAYAYVTLCEPSWSFAEGEGFRLERKVGNARIYLNVAYDAPEKETRRERREPIIG